LIGIKSGVQHPIVNLRSSVRNASVKVKEVCVESVLRFTVFAVHNLGTTTLPAKKLTGWMKYSTLIHFSKKITKSSNDVQNVGHLSSLPLDVIT